MNARPKRVLITGGSGFLGSNLALTARDYYETHVTTHVKSLPFPVIWNHPVDLRDKGATQALVDRVIPHIIVHTAALTDVDYCEGNPNEAREINANITGFLARLCRARGIKMVYISTDAVYGGTKGNYSERDATNPVNIYARSKLEGEEQVREAMTDFLILRINLYGWSSCGKPTLAEWIVDNLFSMNEINLFDDVFFSPLFVNNLCEIVMDLLEHDVTGIINLGCKQAISKYDFGVRIANAFKIQRPRFKAISVDTFSFKAPRPKNTSLCVDKLNILTGKERLEIPEGIDSFRKKLLTGYVQTLKGFDIINEKGWNIQ